MMNVCRLGWQEGIPPEWINPVRFPEDWEPRESGHIVYVISRGDHWRDDPRYVGITKADRLDKRADEHSAKGNFQVGEAIHPVMWMASRRVAWIVEAKLIEYLRRRGAELRNGRGFTWRHGAACEKCGQWCERAGGCDR